MRIFVAGILAMTITSLSATVARADIVVTSNGIFSNCDEAWTYRNGPLLRMLDGAFADYNAEVESRIKDALAEFEKHRKAAEAAYAKADKDQKRRLAFVAGQFLFNSIVKKISPSLLPDEVRKQYTAAQLKVFEAVIARQESLHKQVAEALVTGNPPDDLLTDTATDIALDLLGAYFGPAGVFLTSAASASVEAAGMYWETQPIKDVAREEVDIFGKAITKLHGKSKASQITFINTVKNEIDTVCGN